MSVTSRLVLDKVLDLLLDTVCVVDAEGRFVFVSAACESLLGYTPVELIGRNMIDFVLPEDRERTLRAGASVMAGRSHIHFENRYVHKDGRIVDVMWSARWSEADQLRIAVARDITARRHAERKQRALYSISEAAHAAESLEDLYQHIHRVIADLLPADLFFVALYDEANDILSFPCFISHLSHRPEPQRLDPGSRLARLIRSGETLLLSGADATTRPAPDLDGIEEFQEWLGAPMISPQGVTGALVMARGAARMGYTGDDGDLLQFASTQVATAIERKRAEARLQHIASHDPLTDIPNRALFQDRLDMALKRAHRYREKLALLYLDLDDFKVINDSLGHQAGDLLLCETAKRLSRCVRESDTVGRLGGDEFAVLITNIEGTATVDAITAKLRAAVETPLELEGRKASISVSIGAALYPEHGETPQELFRQADTWMYHSKDLQSAEERVRRSS